MTLATVNKIIEFLGVVRDRPAMYVGNSKDHSALIHFVNGFYRAFAVFSIGSLQPINLGRMNDSQKEMIERGISDEEIFTTLADLEIQAWQKFRGELQA